MNKAELIASLAEQTGQTRGLKSNGTETYAKPTATGDRWFWLQSLASFTQ